MIIDFHTHDFPDSIAADAVRHLQQQGHIPAYSGGTAAELINAREKAGIDLSVVLPVATQARQVRHINDYAAGRNQQTDETGLLSFGCMHPDLEDYREELHRIKDLGLKGIKLHPMYQMTDLDDIRFLRIMDCAAQLDLIVLTHSGLDVGYPGMEHCSPQMARHVVDEIGPFKFVLAHMGGWKEWEDARSLLAGTGVYLDTSFSCGAFAPLQDGYWKPEDLAMMDADEFMCMVRCFGADHILFGTDHPWSDPTQGLAFIRSLPLGEEERDLILGGNAQKLLG